MPKPLPAQYDDDNMGNKIKAWPGRSRSFLNDVRTEMKKVSSPSLKEVQATTGVVLITIFIFGLYFFLIDKIIGLGIDKLLKAFSNR